MSLSFHHITQLYDLQVSIQKLSSRMCSHWMHYIRAKDKTNHLFIHLNLCIALALGLVVFIAGIETASENEVGLCGNIT